MHTLIRRIFVPALISIVALSAGLLPTPAYAAVGQPQDQVTASGFDYVSWDDADLIAGATDNNLVLWYTAGAPLDDGKLRISLPTDEWPTPLHAEFAVNPEALAEGDPALSGTVVVRPTPQFVAVDPQNYCQLDDGISWTTIDSATANIIEVDHVTCAPGQRLSVRINEVAAPQNPGRYGYSVDAFDTSGAHRVKIGSAHVVAPPKIHLEVSVPAEVTANQPTAVSVVARKPDGKVATEYRGAVGLVTADGFDCGVTGQFDAHQFTPADAGSFTFALTFQTLVTHRVVAYDVGRKALSGESGPFKVLDSTAGNCPASYH